MAYQCGICGTPIKEILGRCSSACKQVYEHERREGILKMLPWEQFLVLLFRRRLFRLIFNPKTYFVLVSFIIVIAVLVNTGFPSIAWFECFMYNVLVLGIVFYGTLFLIWLVKITKIIPWVIMKTKIIPWAIKKTELIKKNLQKVPVPQKQLIQKYVRSKPKDLETPQKNRVPNLAAASPPSLFSPKRKHVVICTLILLLAYGPSLFQLEDGIGSYINKLLVESLNI